MEAKRKESILRCMNCGSAISQMRHVFSVGGSDGTTGAYVNEYGVVHQTMTLRQVDGNVVCAGRPETRDSWFPGYSWQIAHCSICSAHLGWKFRKVSKGDDNDPDRPRSFWGFSSLTTDEHVKPRRVIFSPGRNIVALLQLG
jgi:cereblon